MNNSSKRARRMARHQKLGKGSPLNLVSLMDIFTILVFFLLVNSSTSQQLPNQKDLKLPTSIAQKVPKETLMLALTKESILVQGREVARIDEVLAEKSEFIEPLKAELLFLGGAESALAPGEGRSITILGDENAPYELIRKIMATCQQASYTQIAFAAMQTSKD